MNRWRKDEETFSLVVEKVKVFRLPVSSHIVETFLFWNLLSCLELWGMYFYNPCDSKDTLEYATNSA